MTILVALLMFGFLIVAQCCTPEPGDEEFLVLRGWRVAGTYVQLKFSIMDFGQEKVVVNVARNGEASQSSVYQFRVMGYANKAIDGNAKRDFHKGFCTHTMKDYEPWWNLDLKKTYNISSIVITGRQDCCMQRLLGAEVRIGDSPDRKNPVCSKVTDVSKPRITLCCGGMLGRYVSVVITGRSEFLTLCELEVYAKEEVAEVIQKNHVCW